MFRCCHYIDTLKFRCCHYIDTLKCILFLVNINKLGLKAFTFCVVTVNQEHTKSSYKRKLMVKFKDSICTKLCLKLWFESEWYFCNISESEKLYRNKVPNNHFLKPVEVISNQMKYQLSHKLVIINTTYI